MWQYIALTQSFPNLEPVCCSMSSSNCCFLICIQVFQKTGKVVWYSHLLKNFPQFVVIHTVKGFDVVNKAEVDVFLEFSCFFNDPKDLAIWSLVPLPFLNPAWTSVSSQFGYDWSLVWRILSITLLVCEMSAWYLWGRTKDTSCFKQHPYSHLRSFSWILSKILIKVRNH